MSDRSKSVLRGAAATLALAAVAVSAQAATVYGSVSTPPGVYFGSGNPNGNFQVNSDEAGLELAIRAKNRKPGDPVLIDGSTGVYKAEPGTIAPGNVRAMWNYEFSILADGGVASYMYRLFVDTDPGTGATFAMVDPLTYWADNAKYFDAGGQLDGVQASQNVGFGDAPGGANVGGQPGVYTFVLAAYSLGTTSFSLTNALASASMVVDVPEPATLALAGLALTGVALSRRRRTA